MKCLAKDLDRAKDIAALHQLPVKEISQMDLPKSLYHGKTGGIVFGNLYFCNGNATGISLNERITNIQKFCTIFHELGHYECFVSGCRCLWYTTYKEYELTEAHADFYAINLLRREKFGKYIPYYKENFVSVGKLKNKTFTKLLKIWDPTNALTSQKNPV